MFAKVLAGRCFSRSAYNNTLEGGIFSSLRDFVSEVASRSSPSKLGQELSPTFQPVQVVVLQPGKRPLQLFTYNPKAAEDGKSGALEGSREPENQCALGRPRLNPWAALSYAHLLPRRLLLGTGMVCPSQDVTQDLGA